MSLTVLLPALGGTVLPFRLQTPLLVTLSADTQLVFGAKGASTDTQASSSVIEFNVSSGDRIVELPTATVKGQQGCALWLLCRGTTGSLTIKDVTATTTYAKLQPGEACLALLVHDAWVLMKTGPTQSEGLGVATLTGTLTMSAGSPRWNKLDPAASDRIVLLPPEAAGIAYFIENTGSTKVLTVKDDSNTTTVATLYPGDAGWFVCGSSWTYCISHVGRPSPGCASFSAAAAVALQRGSKQFQKIDGGGATRKVVMPAEYPGAAYYIYNAGATNDLQVRDSADAVTLATLTPGTAAWIVYDGTTTYVSMGIATVT